MWRGLSVAFALSCGVFVAGAVSGCSEDPSSLDTRPSVTNSSSGASGTAGTSGGTSGASPGGNSPADICVATINQLRATKGLQPLAQWSDTEACADSEALSDGASNSAHGAFGKCGELAQNECPGWPGPPEAMIADCLKAMWAEGPGGGHYEAMSSRLYTKVSCGFGTAAGTARPIWAVQNFH